MKTIQKAMPKMTEEEKKVLDNTNNLNKKTGVGGSLGNLVPMSERSPEERKAISKAGVKAQKEKKRMEDVANEIMHRKISATQKQILQEKYGEDVDIEDMIEGIIYAQIDKALKGNTHSAEFIRDTSGNKPVEKVHKTTTHTLEQLEKKAIDITQDGNIINAEFEILDDDIGEFYIE